MRQRLRAEYVKRLGGELGEREAAVIATLGRVRVAEARQLERLHFTGSTPLANARAARRMLQRLVELKLLERLERRVGGSARGSAGYVYALSSAGQRLARTNHPTERYRRLGTPGQAFLAHALAVTEVFVRLNELAREGVLDLLEFDAEPWCWRSFTRPGHGLLVLKPDAFVRVGIGEYEDSYFIECDRGTESSTAIASKLRFYMEFWSTGVEQNREGVFPRVMWLVPNEKRRATMETVIRKTAEGELFAVATMDDFSWIGAQPSDAEAGSGAAGPR